MAKEWAKSFYKSKAWQDCRKLYIANRTIYGKECQHCHGKPGYIVDHIIELTPENIKDPEIALNHENLQLLCTVCHSAKTFGWKGVTREDVRFTEDGDIDSI